MRIGDNFSFSTSLSFQESVPGNPGSAALGFVPTPETREICASLLAKTQAFPAPQERGILLDGRTGVGKTHLMRFVATLLERPEDPAWEVLETHGHKAPGPAKRLSTLYITLPQDPSVDLDRFLLDRLRQATYSVSDPGSRSSSDAPLTRFSAKLRKEAGLLANGNVGMLVLDDVTARLRAITDPEQIRNENRLLDILLDVLSPCGLLLCLVGDDIGFKAQEDALEAGDLRRWEIMRIRRRNITRVVAQNLAVKSDVQRARVKMVLDRLRKRFPTLDVAEEVFVELYPIHPHLFPILFDLRRRLPNFSPLQFAQVAIGAARSLPEDQLIWLDRLFDHILPDLRNSDRFAALVASYDELQAVVLPRLKPSAQVPAASLLKGIALLSMCETLPPTVNALAQALLLSPDSGPLPSCRLAAALLIEVEQHAGSLLEARGELLERAYRLRGKSSGLSPGEKTQDDLHSQISAAFHRWFRSRFSTWLAGERMEITGHSFSFQVSVPGSGGQEKGILHLKSVSDPLWSSQNLGAVEGESWRWAILVLNPLEQFYELEERIRALATASPRLFIWRPDQPLPEELSRIKALASPPPETATPGFGHGIPARNDAIEDTLTALYVRRGRLICQNHEWNIGDTLGQEGLEAHMARFLDKMVPAGAREKSAASAAQAPAVAGHGTEQTLHWAALLTGRDELRELDPESAKESVLSWWSSHFEIDPEAFPHVRKSLPEIFMTTKVHRELKMFEGAAQLLESGIHRLRSGDLSFARTMELAAAAFCAEESRARAFATLVQNLPGFVRWLPEFEQARKYLNGAFPIPQEKLEQIRHELTQVINDPLRLLGASERERFNRSFQIYKVAYMNHYQFTHDEALRFMRGQGARTVDSVALRNLELLSGLQYMRKSYINKVGIVGKWIQDNRCSLPVRQILESRPRCHCNFNPADYECIGDLLTQMNDLINEGIDHFRNILRGCGQLVIQDIQEMRIEETCSREIVSLLEQGPMLPLKSQSVDVLNRVIQHHSTDFLTEIQKHQ